MLYRIDLSMDVTSPLEVILEENYHSMTLPLRESPESLHAGVILFPPQIATCRLCDFGGGSVLGLRGLDENVIKTYDGVLDPYEFKYTCINTHTIPHAHKQVPTLYYIIIITHAISQCCQDPNVSCL